MQSSISIHVVTEFERSSLLDEVSRESSTAMLSCSVSLGSSVSFK
jgi:hypothetical protein